MEVAQYASAPDGEETASELAKFIVEWNLLGPQGEEWHPSKEAVLSLFAPTLKPLLQAVGNVVGESVKRGLPPNASGASSANGSRGGASQRPSATTRS